MTSILSRSAGRLFLGVALNDDARRAVRLRLEPFALPGRVVPSDNWHITLRFLGETSLRSLERLREALTATDLGPQFDVVFGGLGAFPNPECAGVLWLGVDEGAEPLTTLAARVDSAVQRAGFPAETRPYAPHVTLSRLASPVDVRQLVERVPALQKRMEVDAVSLFRSAPGRYEEVERFTLA